MRRISLENIKQYCNGVINNSMTNEKHFEFQNIIYPKNQNASFERNKKFTLELKSIQFLRISASLRFHFKSIDQEIKSLIFIIKGKNILKRKENTAKKIKREILFDNEVINDIETESIKDIISVECNEPLSADEIHCKENISLEFLTKFKKPIYDKKHNFHVLNLLKIKLKTMKHEIREIEDIRDEINDCRWSGSSWINSEINLLDRNSRSGSNILECDEINEISNDLTDFKNIFISSGEHNIFNFNEKYQNESKLAKVSAFCRLLLMIDSAHVHVEQNECYGDIRVFKNEL